MLSLCVKVGQAVQIGDVACVKVGYKSGQQVRLLIATALNVTVLPDGIIPARFTLGISGEPKRIEQSHFRDLRRA